MEKNIEREMIEFKGSTGARLTNIENTLTDIKSNHLMHIYKELKNITFKLSSRRPTWFVLWLITSLVTIVAILLTVVMK